MKTSKLQQAIALIKARGMTAYAASKAVGITAAAIYHSAAYQEHTGVFLSNEVTQENRQDVAARFETKFEKTDSGCWLWAAATNKGGYGIFSIGGRARVASRVSYQLYNGDIPDGLCVLHRCDTPLCVNPGHLFLGTKSENSLDRHQKSRNAAGEGNGAAKLSRDDVLKIKADTRKTSALVKEFGVSRTTIQRIRSGKSWKCAA